MSQSRNDGELVELLYAAAAEPNLWPQFVGQLGKRLHAPGASFMVHYPSAKQYRIDASVGLPPESFLPYAERYGAFDPWFLGAKKLRAGTAELGSWLCSPSRFERTAFYNEFMREHNRFFYQCGVMLENRDGNLAALTLLRERNQRDFDERHVRFLARLSRHLGQALIIHRRLMDQQEMMLAATDISGRLDVATIFVRGDGSVCAVTSGAEELLKAGRFFAIQSGKLVCKDRSQAAAFQQLLRTAVNRTLEQTAGGAMKLHDRSHSLYITVLPHAGEDHFLAPAPMATVVLSDPSTTPKSREHLLKVLFGLTQAEMRIAMLLLQGYETNEIADRTGNTANTVRYQLKQIYAKTGVSGQNKIVRLVSQLPGRN